MKLYIYKTDTTIEPFQDHVGDSLILNTSLKDHQVNIAAKWNLEATFVEDLSEIPAHECLVMADYVYCSRYLFQVFLEQCRKEKQPISLGLTRSVFTDRTTPIQDCRIEEKHIVFDLFYHPEGPVELEKLKSYPAHIVEQKEHLIDIELPEGFLNQTNLQFSIAAYRAYHIQHWYHIVGANLYDILGEWMERWIHERRKLIGSILWALFRSFSLKKHKIAGKLSKIGKNCDIHPTALVEASYLGNNVKVGAYSVVRGCYLGNGVQIQDFAHVEGSTIAEKGLVGKNCCLFGSILYPEAVATQRLIQGSLLGRRALTTGGGYLLDLNFQREIRVKHKGKFVSTGSYFCGVCLGHGVRLGTGIFIGYGREIPNGVSIVRDPNDVLFRVPDDLTKGKTYCIRDGSLVSVDRE